MVKKKIGIVGWKTGENSFGITIPYYNFISQFGEVIILEPNGNIRKDLDLLIIPGGPDLPQEMYSDKQDYFNINVGKTCPIRTYFAERVLPEYIKLNTPLFGICLGHQIMAVKLAKGKLLPHMYHETSPEDKRWKQVHKVKILEPFSTIFNITNLDVNSLHHQVVKEVQSDLAKVIGVYNGALNLKQNQKSPYSSHIEALAYIDYPAYSVQWHPEELWDTFSINLIKTLLHEDI